MALVIPIIIIEQAFFGPSPFDGSTTFQIGIVALGAFISAVKATVRLERNH
jgi:hypothetical protein